MHLRRLLPLCWTNPNLNFSRTFSTELKKEGSDCYQPLSCQAIAKPSIENRHQMSEDDPGSASCQILSNFMASLKFSVQCELDPFSEVSSGAVKRWGGGFPGFSLGQSGINYKPFSHIPDLIDTQKITSKKISYVLVSTKDSKPTFLLLSNKHASQLAAIDF